jgi:hypothetical protein
MGKSIGHVTVPGMSHAPSRVATAEMAAKFHYPERIKAVRHHQKALFTPAYGGLSGWTDFIRLTTLTIYRPADVRDP